MEEKLERLRNLLGDLGSVLLAYSGGVDSTFLLKAAQEVLGRRVLAVTACSPTYPQRELRAAEEMARSLGVRFLFLSTGELSYPEFSSNPPDRCYWCKKELFTRLWEIAQEQGIHFILDGTNFDDRDDLRPGRRAAREAGVRSPLLEVGLSKEEIRALSRKLGLSTWDKPSLACLASRIPYGIPITPEVLARINEAEEFLLSLGLHQVRVRHHQEIARIEVESQDESRVIQHREEIVAKLRALGYTYITLDLEGYQPGSLNRALQR